jgi:hypothetical protein
MRSKDLDIKSTAAKFTKLPPGDCRAWRSSSLCRLRYIKQENILE